MSTAYVHINSLQAMILDQVGHAGNGAQALYSAVVLDANSNPVAVAGTIGPSVISAPGQFYLANQSITFTVGNGDSTVALQKAITTAVQTLWNDPTITVVFI
jgi:hypothetical protein